MILYYFRIRSPVGRKIQIEHVKIYRTSPPQSTITQLKAFIEPSMKSLDSTLQRNYSMVERVFYRCDFRQWHCCSAAMKAPTQGIATKQRSKGRLCATEQRITALLLLFEAQIALQQSAVVKRLYKRPSNEVNQPPTLCMLNCLKF